MKPEIKDSLLFCARPSVWLSILSLAPLLSVDLSGGVFGTALHTEVWIHQDLEHLSVDLALWIPVAFLNENKIGTARANLFAVFCSLGIELIFRFINKTGSGLSALVAAQIALLAITRRSVRILFFSGLSFFCLLWPAFVPDPVSRLGHATGFTVGAMLALISLRFPRRSQ